MPAKVQKRGDRFRVVEAEDNELVKRNGKPVDGGGHKSREKARAQARAINANNEE